MRLLCLLAFVTLALPQDGYDEEETRKKNSGLSGQGERSKDDKFAPKLESKFQRQVNEAVRKGVKWLKQRQDASGSWGPVRANKKYGSTETGNWTRDLTGPTSWSIYTLAKCGVTAKDPVVKRGLHWLKSRSLRSFDNTANKAAGVLTTYESASIIMMIEALYTRSAKLTKRHRKRNLVTENPKTRPRKSPIKQEDWSWMHDRILWLTRGRVVANKRGGRRRTIRGTQVRGGGWRYGQGTDQDLSATQFCLLALRAASQAGYPVEKVAPKTWEWAAKYVRSLQQPNGAFSYQAKQKWSASMDACGVGSLVICKEQMELSGQEVPAWMDGAIKKGLAHLDTVFEPDRSKGWHEGGSSHHFYYLYGVERVGDLTGRKEFNGKDWYVRGARFLIEQQQADGKWTDGTGFRPHDVIGTCFALLFLKRATPPTVTISGN